jgi:hypothetical protein
VIQKTHQFFTFFFSPERRIGLVFPELPDLFANRTKTKAFAAPG